MFVNLEDPRSSRPEWIALFLPPGVSRNTSVGSPGVFNSFWSGSRQYGGNGPVWCCGACNTATGDKTCTRTVDNFAKRITISEALKHMRDNAANFLESIDVAVSLGVAQSGRYAHKRCDKTTTSNWQDDQVCTRQGIAADEAHAAGAHVVGGVACS